MDDLKEGLGSLLEILSRPVRFALRNPSRLSNIKNLEPFFKRLCRRGQSLFPEVADPLKEVEAMASGMDNLDPARKMEVLKRIEGTLEALRSRLGKGSFSLPKDWRERLEGLYSPVDGLDGIGKGMERRLRKRGLTTLWDLLNFLPSRYEDRRSLRRIASIREGEKVPFKGKVLAADEVHYGKRRVFEVVVGDGSGIVRAKWFNYHPKAMMRLFKKDREIILYGEMRFFGLQREVIHPEIEVLEGEDPSIHFNTIVPVYPQIEGLHQRRLRRVMHQVVEGYAHLVVDLIPGEVKERYGLIDLEEAIREAHFPGELWKKDPKDWPPLKTLIFEELFCLELTLALKKREVGEEAGISFTLPSPLLERFIRTLPFHLTPAQERVLRDIEGDMASPYRMNRLIQGDVGSGKTVVALASAMIAIDSGYQAAIMAPTEILAEQHFRNAEPYLKALGLKGLLLTGRVKGRRKEEALERVREGDVDLVVGTHALIQEGVTFKALGLVIIDEQHRFGVLQRALLREKGMNPDVLVMTATPIPRTLSMTLFGDLDHSVIDELPPGRKPVTTLVLREGEKGKAYELVGRELSRGRQAFIIYPIIDESEKLHVRDATTMARHLQEEVFPRYRVGLLHGRMRGEEKEKIMADFKERRIDILVSTTVVEVGIDIENATVMVVEHAERFGLSQLHQLRGRVGRGRYPSYCILIAYRIGSEDTYRRLKVMEESTDGFRIAEEDLRIRGPGDFIGTRQSGLPRLFHSNLIDDVDILERARKEAFRLVEGLCDEECANLKEILAMRWKKDLHLATVG